MPLPSRSLKPLVHLACLGLSALVPAPVAAQLLLEESFSFSAAAGDLAGGGSGTGWSGGWQPGVGGGDMATVDGLLQADGGLLAVSGNAVTDTAGGASTIYRQLAEPLDKGSVYLSFLIRFSNRFMGFVGLGTEAHDNVHATASFRVGRIGEAETERELGYWDPVASQWKLTGFKLVNERTYLIVVKAEQGGGSWGGGDDRLSIWVDPTVGEPEPAPDWTAENLNFGTLDTTRLLLGNNWNGPVFDEIRLGGDWSSVTPVATDLPSITVTAENGTVTRDPARDVYEFGEQVTLTAVADEGFVFGGWSGDVTGFDNPLTIPVTGALAIEAAFVDAASGFKLTIESENGTVQVAPEKPSYVFGETVTLTAIPAPGYRFAGWNDAVLDYRETAQVEIRGDLLVRPRFAASPNGFGGAGASVREDLVTEQLHVDATNGIDTNPGTAKLPLRTIGRAFLKAEQLISQGRGVKVLLLPGVYREEVTAPAARFTAPLVIEGAGWSPASGNTGDVILTTAEPLQGLELNADGVYEAEWTENWGFQPDPFADSSVPTPAELLRFEWVLLGNEPFLHKLSYAGLLEATGYAVHVDEAADRIYLKAPAGIDLAQAPVEVSRFRSGSPNGANFLLWIKGTQENPRSHIVVRNLVFEKASPGFQRGGLHIHNADNILVEDVVARLINSVGIVANDADYSTFRRVETHDNSNMGLGIGSLRQTRVEQATISGNNRVGFGQGYVSWTPAGLKSGYVKQSSYIDLYLHGNYAHGLWLDTGMEDIVVERARIIDNARYGLYFENNNRNNIPGLGDTTTTVVRHSYFAGNGETSPIHLAGGSLATGSGLFLVESENLVIEQSVFTRHDEHIGIGYNNRGPLGNLVLRDSILAEPAGSSNALYRPFGNSVAWQQFHDTFTSRFDGNRYYDADATPFLSRTLEPLTFAQWRQALASNPFNPNLPINPERHSEHIRDHDQTDWRLLAIEPLRPLIAEGEAEVAVFRLTRTVADISAPLEVALGVPAGPGRALSGDFDGGLPASVVIPSGSSHVDIVVSPLLDGVAEGPETFALRIQAPAGFETFATEAQVELRDNEVPDLPRVEAFAVTTSLQEGSGVEALFELRRSGETAAALQVSYALGGSADESVDWIARDLTALIPAGETSVTVAVALVDDNLAELPETLELTVLRPDVLDYAPGATATASVRILDDDLITPRWLLRSHGPSGDAESLDIRFHNPTAEPFSYTVENLENIWDLQQLDAFEWIPPAGSPVTFSYVTPNDDGVSGPIALGFDFPFMGGVFDSLFIHSNGFVTFTALEHPGDGYRIPVALPAVGQGVNPFMLAGYWRNWGLDSSTRVFAHPGPDGEFVVTFRDIFQLPAFPSKRRATWQMVLRPSGQAELRILEDATRGNYIIGINGGNELDGLTIAESDLAQEGLRLIMTPVTAFLDGLPMEFGIAGAGSAAFTLELDTRGIAAGIYAYDVAYQPADATLPPALLPLQFHVGVGLSADFWPESTGQRGFWTHVAYLGWVYDHAYPDVYSLRHGWLRLLDGDGSAVLFYDYARQRYAYTILADPLAYPWTAVHVDGAWEWRFNP
jgi:hypothetical protein